MMLAGHLRLHAAVRANGRTALAEQSFRAPFHISKPYWDDEARTLLVQVVNPTAGILAGDRLESEITAGPDTALLVTSPSASRVFTMREGIAECRQQLTVGRNAWLEVSPEPLVPHRGSRYRQHTAIEVDASGALYFVDQLMPGRIGHQESWAWTDLRINLEVRLAGELILRERLAASGPELRQLAEAAGFGATACFANAVLIAPASAAEPAWREEVAGLHRGGTWIGISALRLGGWTIRMVAPNPLRLRETLHAMRHILTRHFPRLTASTRKL